MEPTDIKLISQEEYLAEERLALEKHEFFEGQVFEMGPKSFAHNTILVNITCSTHTQLKKTEYRVYGSMMRLHIPENTLFTYPDAAVYKGKMQTVDEENDNALYPIIIFEITSTDSSEYDRNCKFDLYKDIETLKEYILIDSEKIGVEKFTRNADNTWLLTEFKTIESSFEITAISVKLSLSDIYEDVAFKS